MKLFICPACGDPLRSNLLWPQCSFCSVPAQAVEDRDILTESEAEDFTPNDASFGFKHGSVLLWQRDGRTISKRQADTIDRLLAENRFSQLMTLYGVPA